MNILDDLEKIKKLDRQGMLEVEENFYLQLESSKKIAESIELGRVKSKKFSGIAILGMGGSGFVGDIIKSLVKDEIDIPVEIVKSYDLPGFVKNGWLVIPVSYSGNTEETITAAIQALGRGCTLLCVTAGGEMEKIARENNQTLIKVPSGFQPRGASGYLFFSTYLVLGRIGIIDINAGDIKEALDLINKKASLYRREVKTGENYAKQIALEIGNKLPIIYGTSGILSAVAFRWKCELNENAKFPSFWSEFPELNHNETVGWENLKELTSNFILIIFKDSAATSRIKVRIDTTIKIIKDNLNKIIEIPVEGKSKLAKVMSLMYLGDIASVYLALLNGTDPTPVDKILILKSELTKLDKK
ncbi:MAG: bifunctional phosphoglucose/phosphomannose isomerase [Actinobacteria bacterium]|nr:bifunctional phosphoglucose/phosphomannose isomerase [Actinomycetota bacterium]MCL5069901.1 bifunctional phosphoglucose/phosphomannose isomerase [Actinomycetota bacterium]